MKIVLNDVKFMEALIKVAVEQEKKVQEEIKSDSVVTESQGRIKGLISTLPNEYQQLIHHEISRLSKRLIEINLKAASTVVTEAITRATERYE